MSQKAIEAILIYCGNNRKNDDARPLKKLANKDFSKPLALGFSFREKNLTV